MKVLLVDDEPLELLNLQSILLGHDKTMQIRFAENGMEALDLLAQEMADIVCLDISMPGLNGIETLERIRERWPDLKVALVSAYGEFHYAKAAMELGVSGYILKPVVPEELIKMYQKMGKELEAKRNVKPLLLQAVIEKWLGLEALSDDVLEATWKADIAFEPNLVVVAKAEDSLGNPLDFSQCAAAVSEVITGGIIAPQPVEGYWVYLVEVKSDGELDKIREVFSRLKLQGKRSTPKLNLSYGIGERVDSLTALRKSFYAAVNAAQNKEEALMQQCLDYIESNYANAVTLHDLAVEVHLSPSHLSRVFKKKLGLTFVDVLTKTRIEKAKELLDNPMLSVEVISHRVGFSSPNYFAVTFRKLEGQSPREYRLAKGV
ncbi:response regulator transcription factor [Brevibacillus fluminis]|uniref:response regulator transcription factor n=1 Tax=Brevibacillus fluminis TaxID=511487 RepID=UPI003F8946AE